MSKDTKYLIAIGFMLAAMIAGVDLAIQKHHARDESCSVILPSSNVEIARQEAAKEERMAYIEAHRESDPTMARIADVEWRKK